MQKPHVEEQGVEAPTHAKTSRDGRKRTREVDRLLHDAREYVGYPNLIRNTKNYKYNHKHIDATKKHFISLIEKY